MYDLFYKYLIFTQVLMVQNFVIHSINGNNELNESSCVYGWKNLQMLLCWDQALARLYIQTAKLVWCITWIII